MGEDGRVRYFDEKFSELSEQNQKYIIAIQQALMFSQMDEKNNKSFLNKKRRKEKVL